MYRCGMCGSDNANLHSWECWMQRNQDRGHLRIADLGSKIIGFFRRKKT